MQTTGVSSLIDKIISGGAMLSVRGVGDIPIDPTYFLGSKQLVFYLVEWPYNDFGWHAIPYESIKVHNDSCIEFLAPRHSPRFPESTWLAPVNDGEADDQIVDVMRLWLAQDDPEIKRARDEVRNRAKLYASMAEEGPSDRD